MLEVIGIETSITRERVIPDNPHSNFIGNLSGEHGVQVHRPRSWPHCPLWSVWSSHVSRGTVHRWRKWLFPGAIVHWQLVSLAWSGHRASEIRSSEGPPLMNTTGQGTESLIRLPPACGHRTAIWPAGSCPSLRRCWLWYDVPKWSSPSHYYPPQAF